MNVAIGKHAIAKQVVTYSEDGSCRTVISQQIQDWNANVSINDPSVEVEQNEKRLDCMALIYTIQVEVFSLYGEGGRGFIDALNSLIENPTSKGRKDVVTEEFKALNLHENPVITSLLCQIGCYVDSVTNSKIDEVKGMIDQALELLRC